MIFFYNYNSYLNYNLIADRALLFGAQIIIYAFKNKKWNKCII